MIYIGLGIIGFAMLFVADYCGVKDKGFLKYLSAFSGTFLITSASVIILTRGYNYNLLISYRLIALVFMLLSFLLMIYSVVIEVSKNNSEKKLVTTGTYALTRHPGVLWFLLYYVLGSFVFADYMILIAGIVWTVMNIIYVVLQERIIFNKIFADYEEYKKTTPMIIPTISSIQKCLKTINGGEHEKLTRNA